MSSIGYVVGLFGGTCFMLQRGIKAKNCLYDTYKLKPETQKVIDLSITVLAYSSFIVLRLAMPQTAFFFSGKLLQGTLLAIGLSCKIETLKKNSSTKSLNLIEILQKAQEAIEEGKNLKTILLETKEVIEKAQKEVEKDSSSLEADFNPLSKFTNAQKTVAKIACIGISVFYFGVPFLTVAVTLSSIQNSYELMLILNKLYSRPEVLDLPPGQTTGKHTHALDRHFSCTTGKATVLIDGTQMVMQEHPLFSVPAGTQLEILNHGAAPLQLAIAYSKPSTLEETLGQAEKADELLIINNEIGA